MIRSAAIAGALQEVVANDPFAQRIVSALAPTLSPVLEYASRTPFFSSLITSIANSNNPVVSSPIEKHGSTPWQCPLAVMFLKDVGFGSLPSVP